MERRDQIIAKCIKEFQLSTDQYLKLTELSVDLTAKLNEVAIAGIGIQPDSLDKVMLLCKKGMASQSRSIFVGSAFMILLILVLIF
jgi:hypothetical protein